MRGDECGNEIRADLRSGCDIRLQFRGKGSHPLPLDRRSRFARGVKNRLAADGRFASRAIPNEVQICLKTPLGRGNLLAYQMAFGSETVDLYMWRDDESDLEFAQDTSISEQFVQQ